MTDDTKRSGSSEDSPLKKHTGGPENPGHRPVSPQGAHADDPSEALETAIDPEAPRAAAEADAFANDLVAENETLKNQIEDLTGRLLRAHAENQNLHRRLEREREETAKYAITKFARDVVSVADNFDRAMSSVPADAAESNPVIKSLLEGFTMTEREFLNVLERHKVKRLDPKGELFDPHLHQAMMEQQDPSVPSGTVLQVFQAGYVIEDRVLRPAMVVVAKGGPKPVKTKPGETAPAAADSEPASADAPKQSADSAGRSSSDQTLGESGSARPDEKTSAAANEGSASGEVPPSGDENQR